MGPRGRGESPRARARRRVLQDPLRALITLPVPSGRLRRKDASRLAWPRRPDARRTGLAGRPTAIEHVRLLGGGERPQARAVATHDHRTGLEPTEVAERAEVRGDLAARH